MTDKELQDKKREYAQCLVDGLDKNQSAFKVFPSDNANRMKAMIQWEKDDEVIKYTKEILGIKEPPKLLPSKEEHIEELYEIFRDDDLSPRDRLVASEQISKMQGFITEKKEQNTVINNKIMVVTKSISDEDWEKKAQINQENLMKGIIEVKAIDVTTENQ